MTYNELKNAMSTYNKTHTVRFSIGADGTTLKIGTYHNPFTFTEQNYKEAEEFINQYGMLKEDKDCLSQELYYKGLKWNSLTTEQKDSIINDSLAYAKNNKNVTLLSDSEHADLFENNRCFLAF